MVPFVTMMTFVTINRTILIMMTHMLVGSYMVLMVRREMECVMILTDRMFQGDGTIFH